MRCLSRDLKCCLAVRIQLTIMYMYMYMGDDVLQAQSGRVTRWSLFLSTTISS